ncbi:MAG: hypothetical protein ACI8TP_000091 [Acidimicrobiales bacterium]
MKHLDVIARALVIPILVATSCSGSSDGSSDGNTASSSNSAATSTTELPVILAIAPNLGLSPDQCFAEVPLAEPTTTTSEAVVTSPDENDQTTTQATAPDTLPETTTIPRPPTVAVVDCAGTNLGQVYAVFCLGDDEDDPGNLTSRVCPGDTELAYPGDRNIRRAAARACLQRFAEVFGEQYAASERVAQEFTPNEGVWGQGDRRVVCHASNV